MPHNTSILSRSSNKGYKLVRKSNCSTTSLELLAVRDGCIASSILSLRTFIALHLIVVHSFYPPALKSPFCICLLTMMSLHMHVTLFNLCSQGILIPISSLFIVIYRNPPGANTKSILIQTQQFLLHNDLLNLSSYFDQLSDCWFMNWNNMFILLHSLASVHALPCLSL